MSELSTSPPVELVLNPKELPPPRSRIIEQVLAHRGDSPTPEWWTSYFPGYKKMETASLGNAKKVPIVAFYIMAEAYFNAMPCPMNARLFEAFRYRESPDFSGTRYGRTMRAREMGANDRVLLFTALLGWQLLLAANAFPPLFFRKNKQYDVEDKLRFCVLVYSKAVHEMKFEAYARLYERYGNFSRACCALAGSARASLSWHTFFDNTTRYLFSMPLAGTRIARSRALLMHL